LVGELIIKMDSLTKGIEVKQAILLFRISILSFVGRQRKRTIQYPIVSNNQEKRKGQGRSNSPRWDPIASKVYIGFMLIAGGMVHDPGQFGTAGFMTITKVKEILVERTIPSDLLPNYLLSSIYTYGRRKNFTHISESPYIIFQYPSA